MKPSPVKLKSIDLPDLTIYSDPFQEWMVNLRRDKPKKKDKPKKSKRNQRRKLKKRRDARMEPVETKLLESA